MPFLPIDLLRTGARDLGIELADDQLDQLDRFAEMLVETNRRLNLTRITDPEEIVTGHYLDSLTCLPTFSPSDGAKCIDVGAGGGFPGIPIAIARPDLAVTLLDAARKRVDFLARAAAELGLTNVRAHHGRAEDLGRDRSHRESYDVAWARAVAEMQVLVELCLPLVRVGGAFVAQKSEDVADEVADAKPLAGQLGGGTPEIRRIRIPHTQISRSIVVVRKTRRTPPAFPRPYARIMRRR